MKKGNKSSAKSNVNEAKPGSDPASMKEAEGDFGVRPDDTVERAYTSENTKRSDRGNAQPRSGEEDGVRETGAGGNAGAAGTSSGGDLDTSVLGLGTGGGISQSGADPNYHGANEVTGGTTRARRKEKVETRDEISHGSTVQRGDDQDSALGADGVANADQGSDASAGEVSRSEGTGADEAGV